MKFSRARSQNSSLAFDVTWSWDSRCLLVLPSANLNMPLVKNQAVKKQQSKEGMDINLVFSQHETHRRLWHAEIREGQDRNLHLRSNCCYTCEVIVWKTDEISAAQIALAPLALLRTFHSDEVNVCSLRNLHRNVSALCDKCCCATWTEVNSSKSTLTSGVKTNPQSPGRRVRYFLTHRLPLIDFHALHVALPDSSTHQTNDWPAPRYDVG